MCIRGKITIETGRKLSQTLAFMGPAVFLLPFCFTQNFTLV